MAVETIQLVDDPAQTVAAVARAAEVFRNGGLVIFPTETVYGIGASAASDKGIDALREAKGRQNTQPFSVHLPASSAVGRYIDLSSGRLRRLVRKGMPGPLTLVAEVADEVIADRMKAIGLPLTIADRIYHENTVGLRCPDHDLGRQILGAIDSPIVASSANRRGGPAPNNAETAAAAFGDDVDLIVDGGPCRFAKASTIVRVRGSGVSTRVTVERAGVYDERFIQKMMRWNMLLVCTGNTCRSPMAEGIASKLLADERSIEVRDLPTAGISIQSAGVFAGVGQPASTEAVAAARKMDIDLTRHRARQLTAEMIHEADVIYCMTQSHRQAVIEMAPSAMDKTHMLDPNGDVDDPVGMGMQVYQRCAEMIRRRLTVRLKEQQP